MRASVLCVGETMLSLRGRPNAEQVFPDTFDVSIAGAESNVAVMLGQLGSQAEWFSRVGGDVVGDFVLAALEDLGVSVAEVERDSEAPTGTMYKLLDDEGTKIHYQRSGSAASLFAPTTVSGLHLVGRQYVHSTGVTAALSTSSRAMLESLQIACTNAGVAFSFDVNYRPTLWGSGETARRVLTPICLASDVMFVGRDEAEALWGLSTVQEIMREFAQVPCLVIKDAEVGASLVEEGKEYFVESLPVKVAETVGAGDAFAAGFLAGALKGLSPEARLALGHLAAKAVLEVESDVTALPADFGVRDSDAVWGLYIKESHGYADRYGRHR